MKKEFALRAMISIILLATFFYFIGIEKILNEISKTILSLFILALAIENLGVFLSAKRWQILLFDSGLKLNYKEALSFYYIGSFFNTMMPSSFGGDIIKAYKLGKKTSSIEAFSSVVMDRIAGLIAVIIIATISISFYYFLIPLNTLIISMFIIISFVILISIIIKTSLIEKLIMIFLNKLGKIGKFLLDVTKSIKKHRNIKIWCYIISISILYHLMLVINNYILSLSIGIKTNFIYFLIFVPVSQILVSLPISIQGFGVREGSYSMLFSSVGIDYSSAFSLGFLNQIVKVLTSIIGGVVYVIKK
ncbi:MAG TPA: flippase-like domain-containing protein [Thermoplasmatales archaeon]|nr:flippase-like domain-containing protein [Thermoplasmatales archaeon]